MYIYTFSPLENCHSILKLPKPLPRIHLGVRETRRLKYWLGGPLIVWKEGGVSGASPVVPFLSNVMGKGLLLTRSPPHFASPVYFGEVGQGVWEQGAVWVELRNWKCTGVGRKSHFICTHKTELPGKRNERSWVGARPFSSQDYGRKGIMLGWRLGHHGGQARAPQEGERDMPVVLQGQGQHVSSRWAFQGIGLHI